jgi:hypothetical protein
MIGIFPFRLQGRKPKVKNATPIQTTLEAKKLDIYEESRTKISRTTDTVITRKDSDTNETTPAA